MGELKDKAKGTFDEMKGKATGDDSEELKGKGEQTLGNVKGAAKDVADKVKNTSDSSSDRG